jgi:hypothetical protein
MSACFRSYNELANAVLGFLDLPMPEIDVSQLDAVYEHGLAYARSQEFYDTTRLWQWMRFPGDVVFALGALLMAWDFIIKLRPLLPGFVVRLIPGPRMLPSATGGRLMHPFILSGAIEAYPAGTYTVETDEELLRRASLRSSAPGDRRPELIKT